MPKEKSSLSSRLRSYVREFGENIFSTDGQVILCKLCEVKVGHDKRYSITQHIKTEKHLKSVSLSQTKKQNVQSLLTNTVLNKDPFCVDLCKALVSANIPLKKLNDTHFKSFLEKYTLKKIPDESTIRKNYLNDCYIETMNKIRNKVEGKKVWLSIDETTDIEGRYVANVIIGTLESDGPGTTMLLNSEVLDKANYSTISKLFEKSLHLLWPEGIQHDSVLLFLSDAAPYMVKAAGAIKAFYSKILHVTCLAHGLHLTAEEVRKCFPNVDKLISNVKKIFLKSPYRVAFFKNEAPGLPLPPEPIITRWGTWLNAAITIVKT